MNFARSINRCFSTSTPLKCSVRGRVHPCQMSSFLDIGGRAIFNEDQDLFRQNVRKFMRDELVPLQPQFEADGKPSREIWRKLGEQGLLGVAIPQEVGGIGGTYKDEVIVHEEQAYSDSYSPNLAVHSNICLPYFAKYGTKEQRERFIPDMVSGNKICAIGMTEPDAGSDLQGIRTRAVLDGSDYILNGSKTYISNGILATTYIIVAITDSQAKSKAHGLSLFIVEEDTPGFVKGKNLKKLGLNGQDTSELFFEDVRVPKENILGELNKGFYHLMTELPQERIGIAINAICNAERMFEQTREFIKTRKAFGGTLASLQTVGHTMAEMKTAIAVTRSFIDECIAMHTDGMLGNDSASMAKYWATDLENTIATRCLQLHGGAGYMWETSIAKAFANARVQPIYGGSNEIMKELIARNICKIDK